MSNDRTEFLDFSHIVANEEEVESVHVPDAIQIENQKVEKTKEPLKFEPPDYHNGAIYDNLNYCWSQTFTDLEIHIRLPAQITSKMLKVDIRPNHIDVVHRLDDQKSIVGGALFGRCKALDATWTITDGNKLNIQIEKLKEIWWKKLFAHESDIDVKQIDCSRPFDELSEEMQAQLQQIQFDEQQKLKGEPTSEQSKQLETLKKAWNAEGSPFRGQPFDPNVLQFPGN